jgi:clan AA aspartic protease
MGLIYGAFTLRNPCNHGLGPKSVRALLDTGTNVLCIPPALARELQLDEVDKRDVKPADGGRYWVPYVGPVQLSFGDRHSFAGAFALGDEVRVGTAAIQDLYLVLDTALETVTVHSDSPYLVRGARGCRT